MEYFSEIISAIATLFVSWIAITQTNKANEISDRLLKIEEINAVPCLSVIEEKTVFVEYSETTIHLKVFVKNISNGIIDIKNVSNMDLHIISSDVHGTLKFISSCLNHPTLLPGQEKQLDFSIDAHSGQPIQLCTRELIHKSKCCLAFTGTFDIILGYHDAKHTYKETIKVAGHGKFLISTDVSIREQKTTRSDYKLENERN